MNKTKVPYHKTNYFSKLIISYLEKNEGLKPFYNHFYDIESFKGAIQKRMEFSVDRFVLKDALSSQNVDVKLSESTLLNIQSLGNTNCFTVTTGHQLNLFTGPLYFIYKIISTINLAKQLKEAYPENDFVPIYWMATEDHDFDEVNHFNLFKKQYQLAKTKNGAVGRMKLDGVSELLSELTEIIGDSKEAKEVLALFSKFYKTENSYTLAIKSLVNELFGKYGLVIVDGDDKNLKKLFINEFKNELLERSNHELINKSSEKLVELGFKTQINPREINVFYLKGCVRERIVFKNNKYQVLNTDIEFTEKEILLELDTHPEYFSPNAVMRCMYQEKILPNLAYIGGGGELAYWLQLKSMFDANEIYYPTLILRNSVLMLDEGSKKRLKKLSFKEEDLFKMGDVLVKEYLTKGAAIILDLKEEEERIESVFKEILSKTITIDKSLEPFVKAELQKNIKSLKNVEGRLIKAEKKKEEVVVNQIHNLKERLFPNASLQERHDNIISLFLFYGFGIIEELMEELNPLDSQFLILSK